MPTPRKVNANSMGEGVSKAQFFERKHDTKMEFLDGLGGFNLKNLQREGYRYFLEQNISPLDPSVTKQAHLQSHFFHFLLPPLWPLKKI